uniref:HipA N-terminal domain-containing protein n=1 Tax=Agrococcus sp. KRD186 TaxID=2729730 RepID=UPI0019D16E33|nr:HipA N-terminal domain-containing protein [Agrococcus sp. KRD186]
MRELHAYIDGGHVGVFTMNAGGSITFEYDDDRGSRATPISLSMRPSRPRHGNAQATAWLDGLLPDRESARDAIGAEYRVSARSPFRLLEHVGRDIAGAVQLIPRGETPDDDPARAPSGVRADGEAIAQALRSVKAIYETGAPPQGDHVRLSLAGAQPKIALGRDRSGWYFPGRYTASTYIIKPEVDVNEHIDSIDVAERLTMLAAERLGLDVARSEGWVSPDGDLRALVLERYDREVDDSSRIRRLPRGHASGAWAADLEEVPGQGPWSRCPADLAAHPRSSGGANRTEADRRGVLPRARVQHRGARH